MYGTHTHVSYAAKVHSNARASADEETCASTFSGAGGAISYLVLPARWLWFYMSGEFVCVNAGHTHFLEFFFMVFHFGS